MERRDFLSKMAVAVLAGYLPLNNWASQVGKGENLADLVEVRGSDGRGMVLAAIDALGGIGRFVKPGQRVLLKPTMCFAAHPDEHRNTHPDFLVAVIRLCQKAGAAHVYVLDYSIDEWKLVYQMSGLEDAVKNTGNKPLPGGGEVFFPLSGICSAIDKKDFRIHRQVKQCDVLINLVKAGVDKKGVLMNGMNNLSGLLWERGGDQGENYEEKMLEVISHFPPALTLIENTTLVDLSRQEERKMNCLLASADPVAADVRLYELLGIDWHQMTYPFKAKELTIGEFDPEKVTVQKIYL